MELYKDPSRSPTERAEDLLSRMTLTEKIGQLTSRPYGFRCYERNGNQIKLTEELTREVKKFGSIGAIYGLFRADPWANRDYATGLDGALAIEARNLVQEYVISHSRLGIPVLFSTECSHGHQTLDGYMLPVNLASACTFSPSLIQRAFSVCGQQMHDMGVDLALVSVMDILRDPRWGRCEECFGEDPFLASEMAKAVLRGIIRAGVDTVAKHYCAQGEMTGGVNTSAARIGIRELREIHLPAAKASVEAGAASVMATYNEIDGTYCMANRMLLQDILRTEFGFSGFVMADALAVNRLDQLTGDRAASVAMSLSAGVDMGLLDDWERLEEACERGLVQESAIDDAAKRILTLKFRRGLFEQPYIPESTRWQGYTADTHPVVGDLTEQSIVLLKNSRNLLPLDPAAKQCIAITGPSADDVYAQMGDYSPPMRPDTCVTFLSGMQAYAARSDTAAEILYVPSPGMFVSGEEALDGILAGIQGCGIVFAAVGGSSNRFGGSRIDANGAVLRDSACGMDCGEGVDCSSLHLPGVQTALLRKLKEAGHTVVTVLIGGRPYEMAEIDRYSDAILCCFYPGPLGGKALARLIFGEIAPAGRLAVSLPDTVGQLPVYYNYKQSYSAMEYGDRRQKPAYTFGWGLNYTSFSYMVLRIPTEEEPALTVRIRNTGSSSGWSVPMLFLRRMSGIAVARVCQLAAFDKVYLLPGESAEVTLTVSRESFEQCGEDGKNRFVPGRFQWHLRDGAEIPANGEFRI